MPYFIDFEATDKVGATKIQKFADFRIFVNFGKNFENLL